MANIATNIREDWKKDHINGRVVGNVNNIKRDVTWFVLSDERVVTVHKAYHEHPANSESPKYSMFVSDNETFASVTAQQLDIDYVLLVNADDEDAEQFLVEEGETIKERIQI